MQRVPSRRNIEPRHVEMLHALSGHRRCKKCGYCGPDAAFMYDDGRQWSIADRCALCRDARHAVRLERRKRRNKADNYRANISQTKRQKIYERDGFNCQGCGIRLKRSKCTLDHIVPISRGGTNAIENLQTMCKPCNRKKGNAMPTAQPVSLESALDDALGLAA